MGSSFSNRSALPFCYPRESGNPALSSSQNLDAGFHRHNGFLVRIGAGILIYLTILL